MFIYLPVDGYLCCFQFGVIVNHTAVDIHVQGFVLTCLKLSFDLGESLEVVCWKMCA